MPMLRYVYVLIDKETGQAYKTSNREIPFYKTTMAVRIALKGLSKYVDINRFRVAQYEMVLRHIISE